MIVRNQVTHHLYNVGTSTEAEPEYQFVVRWVFQRNVRSASVLDTNRDYKACQVFSER